MARRPKARNQAEKARRIADALEARGMLASPPSEVRLDTDGAIADIFEPAPLDPLEVANRLAGLPDVGRLMAAELAGEAAEVPSPSTWAAVVAVVVDRIALRAEEEALRVAVRQLEADLDNVAGERDAIRDAHDEIRRDYAEMADANLAGELLEQARRLKAAVEVDLAEARADAADAAGRLDAERQEVRRLSRIVADYLGALRDARVEIPPPSVLVTLDGAGEVTVAGRAPASPRPETDALVEELAAYTDAVTADVLGEEAPAPPPGVRDSTGAPLHPEAPPAKRARKSRAKVGPDAAPGAGTR